MTTVLNRRKLTEKLFLNIMNKSIISMSVAPTGSFTNYYRNQTPTRRVTITSSVLVTTAVCHVQEVLFESSQHIFEILIKPPITITFHQELHLSSLLKYATCLRHIPITCVSQHQISSHIY